MIVHEIDGQQWRKSTFSGGGNDCIFVAPHLNGIFDNKAQQKLPGNVTVTSLVKFVR